jgi:hypothetical protein
MGKFNQDKFSARIDVNDPDGKVIVAALLGQEVPLDTKEMSAAFIVSEQGDGL